MNQRVGTWQRDGLRAILAGEVNRYCFRHLAVETPEVPMSIRLIVKLPRLSRVLDVAIAGTVAYFWLCL